MDHQWLSVGPCLLAAVHEEIFGARMSMDIYEEVNVATLERLAHHFFHAYDFWG